MLVIRNALSPPEVENRSERRAQEDSIEEVAAISGIRYYVVQFSFAFLRDIPLQHSPPKDRASHQRCSQPPTSQ